jgi:23S rRNA (adenine2503-C2)-methyltransferase
LRNRLVPANKNTVGDLIAACTEYSAKLVAPVFEYALFRGINDSMKDAGDLVHLLSGLTCSVNLILANPTARGEFQPSDVDMALRFQKVLIAAGIRTMIRVSRGADIEAGCGQLRSRHTLKKEEQS